MPIKSKKQAKFLRKNKPSVYKKLSNPKYKKKRKRKPMRYYIKDYIMVSLVGFQKSIIIAIFL